MAEARGGAAARFGYPGAQAPFLANEARRISCSGGSPAGAAR